MINILVTYLPDPQGRLPEMADAVAQGVERVPQARTLVQGLGRVELATLRWCHGLAIGLPGASSDGAGRLAAWSAGFGGDLWDALQGKFAAPFVAVPGDVERQQVLLRETVDQLSARGMLVARFSGAADAGAAANPGADPGYERLGRLLAGLVCAWVEPSANPARRRVLGSLVRATRRVPSVRPVAVDSGVVA